MVEIPPWGKWIPLEGYKAPAKLIVWGRRKGNIFFANPHHRKGVIFSSCRGMNAQRVRNNIFAILPRDEMKQAETFRRSSDNHKQPQKLVLNLETRGPSGMSNARTARCQNIVGDLSRSQTNCHSGKQGSFIA